MLLGYNVCFFNMIYRNCSQVMQKMKDYLRICYHEPSSMRLQAI